MQLRATISTWPAPHWLCACGTILSILSSSCPCKHPPRKDTFTDMALYCLRGIFRDMDTATLRTPEKKGPFSLTTLLQILFHQDHLKYVNEWLAKVHPSSSPTSPPILSHTHMKALSPSTNWICNQIGGDQRCKCPDLPNPFSSISLTANYKPENSTSSTSTAVHSPTSTPTPSTHSPHSPFEMETLILNVSNDLTKEDSTAMDITEAQESTAGANTANDQSLQQSSSLESSILPLKNIKQRLGSREESARVPAYFKDSYPPELSPHYIRRTNVLPQEITSSSFSARSIQELYCIEVVQLYKESCPPELGYCTPHMVPSVFYNMTANQLNDRKSWVMRTFKQNHSITFQIPLHTHKALPLDELSTHRIPLEIVTSNLEHGISSHLPFFSQIALFQKLAKDNPSGSRKVPSLKIPSLMDIKFPSFPKSKSATETLDTANIQRRALLPHPSTTNISPPPRKILLPTPST